MPIAVFKNKTFQVSNNRIYTFDGFAWGGDIQSEAQEKLNSKPSTYIKGINLKKLNFEIPLKLSMGVDPMGEIEEWEAIRDSLQPAIFILGTKPLGPNKWLLKSVNVSDTVIDNHGNINEARLELEFEEFVRQGSAQESTKGKAAAVNVNMQPNDYIYNPSTKTEQKRNNPNVEFAVSEGVIVARDGSMSS